jgi:hypothetical protein
VDTEQESLGGGGLDFDARRREQRKAQIAAVNDQIVATARAHRDPIQKLLRKLERSFAGPATLTPQEVGIAKGCLSFMLSTVDQADAEAAD